ncbi:uncharacterized protein [Dysidea avara]|uniref:uncharacterized protein isoform X1 n=2 Tax=Dysidea avara TaxID=196820 RepID=UPI003328CA4E
MEMIIAILLPIIVVVIITTLIIAHALAQTENVKHKRQGCCGSKNVETEDGINIEADDEVMYGEIRYPEEKPQELNQKVITLRNPLYANPPTTPCGVTDLPTHDEILQKQLNSITESDEELNDRMSDNRCSSNDQIFNDNVNGEESQSSSTTTNMAITEHVSTTASNIKETYLTTQTIAADSNTSYNCKSSLDVSQSNSSAESTTDEWLVPVVPNPAYNYKETYLAAKKVALELNPSYNYKSSYTSGL